MDSALAALTRRRTRGNVSAHLVIGRDGEIVQLAPFDRVTWHAGRSRWRCRGVDYAGLNQHAIGIELVNAGPLEPLLDEEGGQTWRAWWGRRYPPSDVVEAEHKHGGPCRGWLKYPETQRATAQAAVSALVRRYRLLDLLGHDDIAPGRKLDPGPAFPMQVFRRQVYEPTGMLPADFWAGPVGRLFSWFLKRRST